MSGILLPVCSIFFSGLLLIVFFAKKRVNLLENNIYSIMLIASFIDSILVSILQGIIIDGINEVDEIIIQVLNKVDFALLIAIIGGLLLYTLVITFKKVRDNFSKILKWVIPIYLIIFLVIGLLNVNVISSGGNCSVGGSAVIVTYVIVALLMGTSIVIAIPKIGSNDKRYIPILSIILILLFLFFIFTINPYLIIISITITFINFLMYFTIENPDIKMIEQVNLAREHAEKANAAKTDFLSSMSHEIRTPLNAIVGFSEAIDEETSLENAKSDAKDIVMAAHNLLEIVNGILDISKIEANKMEIVEKEYNPKELFENISKLIAPRIGEKPIELEVNIAKDLPNVLMGDSGKVKQVVTNIFTNAVKYTEKGKITYTVSCVNLKNESSLVISVEDTGRGIKPEQIDKLFTKFERLEEDRNTTLEGTGLGLAITKSLVEMMGGKIVVQSVYGSGSKFTIYLKQAIVNKQEIPDYVEKQVEIKISDFTGNRVLVVDDNTLNLKVAERLLKKYNLDIDTAISGYVCLDKVTHDEKYDLILMDDMMPKMSGTETLAKLKGNPLFKTPVIALTANALDGMKNKYISLGFNDYLAKPIEKGELERVLNNFLKTKKQDATVEVVIDTPTEETKNELDVNTNNNDNNNNNNDNNNIDNSIDTHTTEYLKSHDIDVDHGLELLGDMDLYNDTMKEFVSEMENRLPKLKEYKENGDMPNYAILVHAIKSDCKYLGIMKLADHNYEHELKSKANDVDFVNSDYDNLINDINKYIEICKNYIGSN